LVPRLGGGSALTALRGRLRHYAGPRLLVIDEVGYLSNLVRQS
jgi:hypothetical protein